MPKLGEFELPLTGVISFADSDAPTEDQQAEVMDQFERLAFAGLDPEQYEVLWVRHAHEGRVELHFCTPRLELTTGKSLNIAPPGYQDAYDSLKPYDKFERIAQDKRRGKTSRVERKPADKEWIEAFCKAADPYNAALVRFMFETAARIDQAVSIEPDDLWSAENKVRVKAQKGHPESWITVSPQMMDELLALPPKRPKNRKSGKFMCCVRVN